MHKLVYNIQILGILGLFYFLNGFVAVDGFEMQCKAHCPFSSVGGQTALINLTKV